MKVFRVLFWTVTFLSVHCVANRSHAQWVPVRLAYSSSDMSFLPLLVAKDVGLFEKYGVKPEVVYITGGSRIVQALLAEQIDFAYDGGSPVVAAVSAGGKIKFCAVLWEGMPYKLYGRTGLEKRFNKIKDLHGLKGAIAQPGSESMSAFVLVLKKAGLTQKDMTLLQIGGSGERLASLVSGAVDVIPLVPPITFQAEKLGLPLLVDLTKQGIPWLHTGVIMRTAYVKQHPEVNKKILQATVEATFYALRNKEEAKRVMKKYFKLEDKEVLEEGYEAFSALQVKTFVAKDESVRNLIEATSERLKEAANLAISDIVDFGMISHLKKEGFIDAMKKKYGAK